MSSGTILSRFSIFTGEHPSLEQFVLLSLMLHALAIVLFGDTTGGGARRGEKLWGALTVTVQALIPDRGTGLKLDRGATLLQPTQATRSVPASRQPPAQNREARAAVPVETPPPAPDVAPPPQASAVEMPPVISTDVERAVTEFVVPKASADRLYTPPTLPPEEAPRAVPVVPLPPAPPPVVAPTPLPVAAPPIERSIVPPVVVAPTESRSREEAIATPRPAPPPAPSPKIEREAEIPVIAAPKPREVVTPIVQPVAPAPTIPAREIVPPVVPAAEPKPREIVAPAPVAPPALAEPPARAEATVAPKIEREVVKAAAPSAPAVTAPAPPPTTPFGTPVGNAGADRDLLKPQVDATTPSSDALAPALGKAPGIDLDAVRRRAREISSGGTGPRTVFPFPGSPPQKPKSKEQQAFDKALKKNDCRDAYSDMGLAAVVPLVLSAVREDGCKW